jgi:hypothetical protein
MTQRVAGLDPKVQERAGLTRRQAECLDLRIRGASYRYIAIQLGIAHVTVREQRREGDAQDCARDANPGIVLAVGNPSRNGSGPGRSVRYFEDDEAGIPVMDSRPGSPAIAFDPAPRPFPRGEIGTCVRTPGPHTRS